MGQIMKELKKDQLYLLLRDRILSGELPHGFRFPPEGEYCRELKVGRVTLRSALEQLQRDRLIKRIPRRGTFVNLPPRKENCILIVHSINLSAWNPAYWILAGMENKIRREHTAVPCFRRIIFCPDLFPAAGMNRSIRKWQKRWKSRIFFPIARPITLEPNGPG